MSFLYRDHRGGYTESMATVQRFNNLEELIAYLIKDIAKMGVILYPETVEIKPYGNDNRNGWDTHIVTGSIILVNNSPMVFGFTDGIVLTEEQVTKADQYYKYRPDVDETDPVQKQEADTLEALNRIFDEEDRWFDKEFKQYLLREGKQIPTTEKLLTSPQAETKRETSTYVLLTKIDQFLHKLMEDDRYKEEATNLHGEIHEESFRFVTGTF